MHDCPFCDICEGKAPASMVRKWRNVFAFVPLNPVVEGHILVVPLRHVTDAAEDPEVTAETYRYAAQLAAKMKRAGIHSNLITSIGEDATQTVKHLHVHVVPRRPGDGLKLPWTGQDPAPALPSR